MKAISLTQPWATLVAIKAKRIETRAWWIGYRGTLAIHAAKGYGLKERDLAESEPFWSALRKAGFHQYNLPLGAVVAVARLVAVRETFVTLAGEIGFGRDPKALYEVARTQASLATISEQERAFGDYRPGRYAWLLQDVVGLETPIPARGALGLWEWTPPVDTPIVLDLKGRA